MKLKILDNEFKFENKASEVNSIINTIEGFCSSSDYILNNVIIDGESIQDYQAFIEDNISLIEEIIIEVSTIKEFINEIFLNTLDYLEKATPQIEALADTFYSANYLKEDDINKLGDLIEAIQWILETFHSINKTHNYSAKTEKFDVWEKYSIQIKKLDGVLIDLSNAIDTIDLILIADILKYEISFMFKEMIVQLKELVDVGADRSVN
ncbi:hypothetical protein [Alkaliphilus peptidifermentans]|uniref:Uncharacterized protein n=1 Tax=Alkaliphilus peptidifermentans DSM 18978 TaxID=1120976 RepID=A0A1G5JEN2_9FIRM|nr:hypothetical protein [Alkaliphilus peptidifermentans]SCY86806.1 hypothetical protein SAMN03080606_02808 [Alkaliphilus peptidifermentans DSM 18978]